MTTPADTDTGSRPISLREVWRTARPRPKDLFHDLILDYEDYHDHVHTGNATRARLIATWIDRGSRVLDAGCGDGSIAEFLARERGAVVEGIDLADAAVEKTRARGIPARVQDLDANPSLPEGFDYILFVEVLEHLRYPHAVLREASSRAVKGVVVTIPNSAWAGYRLQMLFGHAPVQSFTHLHFWSHKDFLAFCDRLGIGTPEARFLTSDLAIRSILVRHWPNLLAHQLAYRIPTGGSRR